MEFLKIYKETNPSISALVEDFFDTALIICKFGSEGKKQLLDSFFFTLGFIIMENWAAFHIRLEALKTFNFIIDNISREEKRKLQSSDEICELMQSLARKLYDVGDFDIQVAISEALCRMTTKKLRTHLAHLWFEDNSLAEAFKEISDKDFETDCRSFLNFLNSGLQDARRVYTFPCINVFTDVNELTKPEDDKLEHFWIDFNVATQCVSFYIQNREGCLWDSVRLHKENLSGYSLEDTIGLKLLKIFLKNPQSVDEKETKLFKILFEPNHDIQRATIKTYGGELQMDENNESLREANASSVGKSTGKAINATLQPWKKSQSSHIKTADTTSDILHSQTNDLSSPKERSASPKQCDVLTDSQDQLKDSWKAAVPRTGEQAPASVLSDATSPAFPNSPVSGTDVKVSVAKEKILSSVSLSNSPAYEKFEFPNSPVSATDIELPRAKEKILSPVSSSSRKGSDTPRRTRSQTDSKKVITYREMISSQSDEVSDAIQNEKIWIPEHQKRSSRISADYSRKKPKSKLKVLPLCWESSDEELKDTKKGLSLGYTAIKKATRKKRGMAKSLSFSELELPGVSALLTPMDSVQQASGTLVVSDLDDQDLMDPLQEDASSPEHQQPVKSSGKASNSDTASKIATESKEDQMVLLKGLNTSDIVEDLKKKRKRSSSEDHGDFSLKPRKLFSSSERKNVSEDLKDDVFQPDSHTMDAGCSFLSSFESFTEDLNSKIMSRYKRMGVRAQDVLSTAHSHVSNLINQIQRCNIRKLDHFRRIVVQELSSLESDNQVLKDLEKETLEFWEAQTVKINEFCTNQKQRFEAVDYALNDTMSMLTNNEEQVTGVKTNRDKPS
ncbi:synaptonemal complex protein 2-like isoform X2 [Mixophyes fleayi]|uniref:synaptonemal complex protein 2-like isoform X2 n=1 Tax=Mixophyes fleayi TaxID=3061075 RepID=UPI003F4DD5DE